MVVPTYLMYVWVFNVWMAFSRSGAFYCVLIIFSHFFERNIVQRKISYCDTCCILSALSLCICQYTWDPIRLWTYQHSVGLFHCVMHENLGCFQNADCAKLYSHQSWHWVTEISISLESKWNVFSCSEINYMILTL